jgi:hypothetical protein
MTDPKRLLDRDDLGKVERRLLESGRDVDPSEQAHDALWGALAQRIALTAATEVVVTKAATGVTSAAVRVGAVVKSAAASALLKPAIVAVAAVGISAAALTYEVHGNHAVGTVPARDVSVSAPGVPVSIPPSNAPSNPLSKPPSIPPSIPRPLVVADTQTATALPSPATPPATPPATVVQGGARPRSVPTVPSAELPPDEPVESAVHAEGALVLQARAAVRRGDCAAALQPLNEANARYPRGTLRQERDALTIEALACGGQSAEASSRAAAFLRDYPGSPYADAMKRFVH